MAEVRFETLTLPTSWVLSVPLFCAECNMASLPLRFHLCAALREVLIKRNNRLGLKSTYQMRMFARQTPTNECQEAATIFADVQEDLVLSSRLLPKPFAAISAVPNGAAAGGQASAWLPDSQAAQQHPVLSLPGQHGELVL